VVGRSDLLHDARLATPVLHLQMSLMMKLPRTSCRRKRQVSGCQCCRQHTFRQGA
jgi:hypothetical protein